MISIEEALKLVKLHSKSLLKETRKSVVKAGGYFLFKDCLHIINDF